MAFTIPIFEVQTGGDDTNFGGIFDIGVAGFPTDGAATSATGSTPTFSSASYNFVDGDIGHWIFIKSGTHWQPGWYNISSRSGNNVILDAAVGHVVLYLSTNEPGFVQGLNTTAGCSNDGTASPTTATWGIDYTQKGTSRITYTDMVIGGTTTQFTSAANPVGKNLVGNSISVTSGTGFTVQRVVIASTSGTTATCDKSLGTGGSTGGNGRLGGPFATVGKVSGLATINNQGVWIKSGSYSTTSASTNVAAGCVSNTNTTRWEGYGTYRSDMGTAPVITAGNAISTFVMFSLSTTYGNSHLRNVTLDGASLTSSQGVAGGTIIEKVTGKNFTNSAFVTSITGAPLINCSATGCSTQPAFTTSGASAEWVCCEAYNNTITGFKFATNNSRAIFCIASGNTGASSDGFNTTASGPVWIGCTAYGNGRHGFFHDTPGVTGFFLNNVSEGNGVTGGTGWGFTFTSGGGNIGAWMDYNAAFNNPSGNFDTGNADPPLFYGTHNVIYTATAFTNAGAGDFSPNNTVGGGKSLRNAAFPGGMPRGTSTGFNDIGAVQSGAGNPNIVGQVTAIFGG